MNVKDANGCTSGAQIVSVGNVDTLVGSVASQTNVLCNGGANGSLTVVATGGTSPYNYSINGGPGQSTPTFSGLSSGGPYSISITDTKGCSAVVDAQITQPAVLQVVVDSTISVSCGIAHSGGILTHAVGGTSPYVFLWSNNDATANISGLDMGTYSVVVTDSNSCTGTASAIVGFDSSLLLNAVAANPLCYGDNGSVSITVNNGTAPFIYTWSNGDTSADVTNLALGSTTVSVTDANHCTATQTFIISQPQQVFVAVDSVQPVCNTATGSASATGSGGSGPYIYTWSSGSNGDTASNLAPGTYTVTVYDSHNCTAVASFSVSNQSGLSIATVAVADSCFGGSDGSAQANVTGGAGSYTYAWSNGGTTSSISNVAAGLYIITATDSVGCSVSSAVTVTEPGVIHPVISTTGASVGQNNGSATIDSIQGGTGPFTVQWSNSQSGATITNLAIGTYTLTITDHNGCSQSDTVVISQTTGISTVDGNIQMVIYPNPAKNEISVDLGSISALTTLSVRNVLGQQVIFKQLNAMHNSIDISGLGSGVYTFQVREGANVVVQEVIVNK